MKLCIGDITDNSKIPSQMTQSAMQETESHRQEPAAPTTSMYSTPMTTMT